MITYVRALSRREGEDVVFEEPGPWISIHDGEAPSPVAHLCASCLAVRFEDSTDPRDSIAPTEHHARMIHAFVKALHESPEPIRLHVHCAAGISRSGAVAVFTQQHFSTMPIDEFRRTSPQVCPNNLLLRLLEQVSGVNRSLAAQFGEVE